MKNNSTKTKHIVVFGGTSDIAQSCLHKWCSSETIKAILVGRDSDRLNIVRSDLEVRFPDSEFIVNTLDFDNVNSIEELISNIYALNDVDISLIAHGNLLDQIICQDDIQRCNESLMINGVSVCLILESIIKNSSFNKSTLIGVISSVAGDRARKSNYIYGSAKNLINFYVAGLRHRLSNSKIRISLIKPGPTLSSMTKHLIGTNLKLASIDYVSSLIVKGMSKNKKIIYAPRRWFLIMLVIKNIPNLLFKKLNI